MATTYYRIAPKPMTDADLHEDHVSRLWVCSGDANDERRGLSCCPSYADLVHYFCGNKGENSVGRGASLEGAYLVELEGDLSDDAPWERNHEALIHPTRIVAQEPVTERFVQDVVAAMRSAWNLGEDERAVHRPDRDCFAIEAHCRLCEGTGDDDGEECWECDGHGWVETAAGDR